jgi:pyridoxamine 5'-phosphate oxidase
MDYLQHTLSESDAGDDPVALFARWLADADATGLREPLAMTLATADGTGQPSARVVLLRDFGPEGFTFYSNYYSRKGAELAVNPRAALCFWWGELERQVRAEGSVTRLSAAESDAYFAQRARGSQLAATISPQSQPVPDRPWLEARLAEGTDRYADQPVPRPDHWGGYRLLPTTIEFWQGRLYRLHDRLRYQRLAEGWRRERLAP